MRGLERLGELWAKVDTLSARVLARYPGELACGPGCSDCCHKRLTVTGIEARAITALVARLPEGRRQELADRARRGRVCAALDDDGRCGIYEARPVVCRSHGLVLRIADEPGPGRVRLPVVGRRSSCDKNFTRTDPEAIDAACVLDQETLSILVGAIDAADADATGRPRGARQPIEDVLIEAAAPAPGGS